MIRGLNGVNFRNKTVIVRVDLNSPYNPEKGKIEISDKFEAHSKTIKELSEKGAKIVLLSHQGWKGDQDFTHLNEHAKILSEFLGKKVEFVDDVVGEKVKKKIGELKPGEIVLLDNVRILDDETKNLSAEEHAKSKIVRNLSPLADAFVNDAFSVSHRAHASVIGFTEVLPCYAGRVMEEELKAEEKALSPKGNNVFVVGGSKIAAELEVLSHMLRNRPKSMKFALTGGLIGNMFLLANGHELGEKNKKVLEERSKELHKNFEELLEKASELMENCDKIITPLDLAIEKNGREEILVEDLPTKAQILDIGTRTIKKYSEIIEKADAVIFKGPLGVYEKKGFEIGTKEVLGKIKESKIFSLIGGGNTLDAMKKLGFRKEEFSHVSLGGGALITFLSGREMPGIKALDREVKNGKGVEQE